MKHTTGYHVWLAGLCYWHRSLAAAERRYQDATWCGTRQIIDVATGDLIAGQKG